MGSLHLEFLPDPSFGLRILKKGQADHALAIGDGSNREVADCLAEHVVLLRALVPRLASDSDGVPQLVAHLRQQLRHGDSESPLHQTVSYDVPRPSDEWARKCEAEVFARSALEYHFKPIA